MSVIPRTIDTLEKTVRQFRRHLTIEDCDVFDPALTELAARARLAERLAEELEHGYWDETTDKWRCSMCDATEGHDVDCSHGALLSEWREQQGTA